MSDDALLFKALADQGRRKLMDRHYLAVLEAANLLALQWRGREKVHFLIQSRSRKSTNARFASSRNHASSRSKS